MILTQLWVCRMLQKFPPRRSDIIRWKQSLLETGYIGHKGGNDKRGTNKGTIQQAKDLLWNYSILSIRAASGKLQLPPTTTRFTLHNRLFLFPYKPQNVQDFNEGDKQNWLERAKNCSTPLFYTASGRRNEHKPGLGNNACIVTWCGILKEYAIGPYFPGLETLQVRAKETC